MILLRRRLAGKPVIGIRTANHAFSLRGKKPPANRLVWEDFDREVIGGNYTGHHGVGPAVAIDAAKEAKDHPILKGVDVQAFKGRGSLYIVSPLREGSTALLIGRVPEKDPEPIAWTHRTSFGGKVFYTSLGHVGDFEQPAMAQLLKNALAWAVRSE